VIEEDSRKVEEKYSVLMSIYYKEKKEPLMYSIESMLNQTVFPDEIVLVEDGPLTDELYEVIDYFDKKYVGLFKIVKLEKNVGLGLALQRGILECRNELIARMDSDDYSVPDRMEKQLKKYHDEPDLGMIGTNVDEFIETIDNVVCHVILPEKQDKIYKFSKRRCPMRHPTLLYKKSEVLKAGNYRNFYLFEDYDLYVRMLRSGCKCYNIQEPLVYVRTDKEFYKRRGGIKYVKTILKFKNEQLKIGYFSVSDWIISTIPHIIVCIIPNNMRDMIYKNFLRKKERGKGK